MNKNPAAPKNIEEYIATFPQDVQEIMQQIRMTIQEAAPDVEETISYLMPAFRSKGAYLVHIAAYKKHIGLYPAPAGIAEFEEAVSVYGSGKSTLRFPLDQPIPFDLISQIVKYRAAENLSKAAAKAHKREQS